jgi:hypothetical protein
MKDSMRKLGKMKNWEVLFVDYYKVNLAPLLPYRKRTQVRIEIKKIIKLIKDLRVFKQLKEK